MRARWIHEHLQRHYAPDNTRIWGDSANPTDINEINKEFKRLGSPYRVRPVAAERKLRRASVTKINNLLGRGALLIRRDLAEFQEWQLHRSAASDGQTVLGSRSALGDEPLAVSGAEGGRGRPAEAGPGRRHRGRRGPDRGVPVRG